MLSIYIVIWVGHLLLRSYLLVRLLWLLRVALIGISVDGLAVPCRLAHLVLVLLLLWYGLSSDGLLGNLLVMHLDYNILTRGLVVAADGSIIFHNSASTLGSSDAGNDAEDKEESSECPPEPDESGMTGA